MAEFRQETSSLTSALHAAESRLTELYADQARAEEEMGARMEIAEKLRSQVRELEKEKRDALRRYAEQSASFDAERQALYDNEQHLKSRIQSLTAARKAQQEAAERSSSPVPSIAPSVGPEDVSSDTIRDTAGEVQPGSPRTPVARNPLSEDDSEISDGPEITALKLELSTLSTSHASLQTMVQMLQTELADLKRVNNELQEENESYGLLLMERALNGAGVDMLRQIGGQDQGSSRAESVNDDSERASIHSNKRSLLDRVPEDDEYTFSPEEQEIPNSLASELRSGGDLPPTSASSTRKRRARNGSSSPTPGTPVGESLADLPITGPGLDLAAELGRAESKDILDGVHQESPSQPRSAKADNFERSGEVDALRQEVKSLKDANKALSLYASKIIDRIIMQEGFEHVLSVDYDPSKPPPTPKSPSAFDEAVMKARSSPSKPVKQSRPQSLFLGRSTSVKVTSATPKESSFRFPTSGEPEKLTTFNTPASPTPDARKNRRSLSFDWKSFSIFGGGASENAEKEKNLRPLTLRPGASSTLTGARKLESQEDEDDRKERERLNATMKLMGIEKPEESFVPLTAKPPSEKTSTDSTASKANNRFSWFRRAPNPPAEQSQEGVPPSLTSEALEQAEAESSLASLDAREKVLTAEISKGGSGGFTELNHSGGLTLGEQWRNRRSRSTSGKSHDSSGASTVWSAGKGDEE